MLSIIQQILKQDMASDPYSKRFELGFKERIEFEADQIAALLKVLLFIGENVIPIQPQKFYSTINGSVIYSILTDEKGFHQCLVVKGGHGNSNCKGDAAGETFWLDPHGLFPKFDSVDVLGMCPVKELGDWEKILRAE